MKKLTGLGVTLGVLVAGLTVYAVGRSTPASAEPMEQVCICHATQQNKVEGNTPTQPNPNQKYILICPNGNSSQKVKGHANHPDDFPVVGDPESPPTCDFPRGDGQGG